MRTERVPLRHVPVAAGAVPWIALRELQGRDELAVDGVDTRAALALLDRLIGQTALPAASLCAADRDALLAALHRREWGDRIVTTLVCVACGERFDLSFALSAVQAHLAKTATGMPVSPPSGQQELDAASQGARAGVAALGAVLGTDASADADAQTAAIEHLAATLEAEAPILDLEITAECAECGHPQAAHFDVQSFVLQRLIGERALLQAEVHQLASQYGWSLREILGLSRPTRRGFVRMIDDARSLRR
jgi:hypothetical protein